MRLLRFLAQLVLAALELPFAFIYATLVAIGVIVPDEPAALAALDNAADDVAATAEYDGLTEVRKWATATLRNEIAVPAGRHAPWLAALGPVDALRIAKADAAGRLAGHLSGTDAWPNLPPPGSYEGTIEWKLRFSQPRLGVRNSPAPEPEPLAAPGEDQSEHPEPQPVPRFS